MAKTQTLHPHPDPTTSASPGMALFGRNFRTFAPLTGATAAGSLMMMSSQVRRAARA